MQTWKGPQFPKVKRFRKSAFCMCLAPGYSPQWKCIPSSNKISPKKKKRIFFCQEKNQKPKFSKYHCLLLVNPDPTHGTFETLILTINQTLTFQITLIPTLTSSHKHPHFPWSTWMQEYTFLFTHKHQTLTHGNIHKHMHLLVEGKFSSWIVPCTCWVPLHQW